MSVCDSLTTNASAGVAPALRAVDCLSNEATANATVKTSDRIIQPPFFTFFGETQKTGN